MSNPLWRVLLTSALVLLGTGAAAAQGLNRPIPAPFSNLHPPLHHSERFSWEAPSPTTLTACPSTLA